MKLNKLFWLSLYTMFLTLSSVGNICAQAVAEKASCCSTTNLNCCSTESNCCASDNEDDSPVNAHFISNSLKLFYYAEVGKTEIKKIVRSITTTVKSLPQNHDPPPKPKYLVFKKLIFYA